MPRICTICTHAERDAINRALIESEPYRNIAARFDTSTGALQRHKSDHMPVALVQAQEAQEAAQADDLLAQVRDLQSRAMGILDKAEKTGDLRTALSAIREARSCLELLAELVGELDRRAQVNITMAPEWLTIRTVILQAVQPYPEARTALVDALGTVNGHAGN